MKNKVRSAAFRLILIRHAEAEGQGRYLGRRSNPPLSITGCRQAELLRNRLSAETFGNHSENVFLFSSPQKRACETAEILFPAGGGKISGTCRPEIIPEFAEIDFGDWEGMTWNEISAADEERYKTWINNPLKTAPPGGGETLGDFGGRIDNGFETVSARLRKAENGTAFLVVHGGVIRMLLCRLLALDADKYSAFHTDCASYSSIRVFENEYSDRSAVLEYMNRRY